MNKLLTTVCIVLLSLTAQGAAKKKSSNANQPFHKGTNTLGIGLGASLPYNYYFGTISATPTFLALFDHGIVDHLGPGNLGVGGIIAVKSAHTNFMNDYKASWTTFTVGVRATWHLTLLVDKNNKFDPYGGVTAGLRVNSYKNTYYDKFNTLTDPYNHSNVNPISGVFVGANYNFSKHFGAFAEVGYDISLARAGLCIHF